MSRSRIALFIAFVVLSVSTVLVHADVRADEKGRVEFAGMLGRMVNIFGGKAAREGLDVDGSGERRSQSDAQ